MSNRVERLRVYLLGSAIFLLLVIAAFIGSARYLAHLRVKLPAKLGMNIVRETDGYTYNQTVQGKTVYSIHAAKAVEHTDGKIALHDVSITLYGRKGDRHDHIYGDEFEYDQKASLVRATGIVHIDIEAAEEAGAGSGVGKSGRPGARPAAKVMHMTTSGLVYMEKLGVAATSEYIEFQMGGMTGHATGADYTSDSGKLMLHSAVSMSGIAARQPVEVTASTAELDNRNQQTFLTDAKYVTPGKTAEAEQATLYTRSDGTLARVAAQGKVTVEAAAGTVVSQRADVAVSEENQPQSALLTGGVVYSSDGPLRQARGQADQSTIAFDAKGAPEHAVFTGAVHMTERTRATLAPKEPWSTRDLTAAKVEAALVPVGTGNSQLRDAEATGSPHLTVVNNGSLASASGEGRTDLSADDLKAHLVSTGDAKQPPQLDTVAGRGHTLLRQVGADGIEQTSAGDELDAKFRLTAPRKEVASAASRAVVGDVKGSGTNLPARRQAADTVLSAVQQGHVAMTRRVPAQSGTKAGGNAGNDVQHATAERAEYDGDRDRVTLTGGVALTDAGSVLWANQVSLDHETGDAHAEGAVKVDYVQGGSPQSGSAQTGGAATGARRAGVAGNGSQAGATRGGDPAGPTHILAERAEMEHATEIATFYGKPARLWQGGSQVQAPEIEFSRKQQRLIARSEASTGWSTAVQPAQVHTVLARAGAGSSGAGSSGAVGSGAATSGCAAQGSQRPAATATAGASRAGANRTGAGAGGGGAGTAPDAMLIASGGLIYSGILGQADFTGGMRAESVEGTVRAGEATVYLQQEEGASGATGEAGGAPSLSGRIERMVATGKIDIEQPGLHATGERLVYTASDQLYELTGDAAAPPKAVNAQGTMTAAELRFHSCDDSGGGSIEAVGAVPGEPAQRVRTESRVSDDRKTGKGRQ